MLEEDSPGSIRTEQERPEQLSGPRSGLDNDLDS